MAIKSNNAQGNPYHDEGDGKFTSPDAASNVQKNSLPTLKN